MNLDGKIALVTGGAHRLPKEGSMNIAHLLAGKGRGVVTIRPEESIRQALGLLVQHNIGALVVVGIRLLIG